MKRRIIGKNLLSIAISLIFLLVTILLERTNLVWAGGEKSPLKHIDETDHLGEEFEISQGVNDRILTPRFSSPLLKRNPFSPPLSTKQKTTKPRETPQNPISQKIKPPDNTRLTGIVSNKLGKSAIIEISGESYLVYQSDSIAMANQKLEIVKITTKKVIIKKGRYFFTLMFLAQGK